MLNVRTFQNCTTSVFESLPQAFLSETKQFRSLAKRWQDRSGNPQRSVALAKTGGKASTKDTQAVTAGSLIHTYVMP